jgi:hypothetical protein
MTYEFRQPLWLDDWDQQSVWGYDEAVGSHFAQLWRNSDSNDAPTVWISGMDRRFRFPEQLFAEIRSVTGAAAVEVLIAMHEPDAFASWAGARGPGVPGGPPHSVLVDYGRRLLPVADHSQDPYARGAYHGLCWVTGANIPAPVTGATATPPPGPIMIEAERWAATAAVYQRRDQPQAWFVGVETALMWVAGRADQPVQL